ncbi:TolC family protein [Parendozoicomonas sp. Alg238-R29]|uniref:TolC family protein n=1 Tax=Parendozoicomonas sp. Alg238-R29 TaxID=2993446 RepID=UPI00248D457A|nr:TolC family protein [Parendozoicomonas sp. Alg238-R29]
MFSYSRRNVTTLRRLAVFCLAISAVSLPADELTLPKAEQLALSNDYGVQALQAQSSAFAEQAVAADTWRDPVLSIGTMNLPGNNPDPFNQGMFELKVQQMLPRGSSNKLQRRKVELQGESREVAASNRRLQVLQSVRLAWLDIWYWQQGINQLKQDRYLFESLVDVTESLYSQGKKKQQDLFRAEVELTRLDDRIVSFVASKEQSEAQLLRWLGNTPAGVIPRQLPDFALMPEDSKARLQLHPLVIAAELDVQQAGQDVALANESYKPQFGVELKYGREQMNTGASSRNRFSAMLMMDIPLFTGNRQDRQLTASHYRREAGIAQRLDTLQQLQGEFDAEQSRYEGLLRRVELYRKELLPKVRNQADAALRSYQSDASDFNDVIQAYKAQLTSSLEFLRLQADSRQSAARLQYFAPAPQDLQQTHRGEAL